jgi:hypothetical protein
MPKLGFEKKESRFANFPFSRDKREFFPILPNNELFETALRLTDGLLSGWNEANKRKSIFALSKVSS